MNIERNLALAYDDAKSAVNLWLASEANKQRGILAVVNMTIEHSQKTEAEGAIESLGRRFGLEEVVSSTGQITLAFNQRIEFAGGGEPLILEDLEETLDATLVKFEDNPRLVAKAVQLSTEKIPAREIDAIAYVPGKGWAINKWNHDSPDIWRIVEEEHLADFIKSASASEAAA